MEMRRPFSTKHQIIKHDMNCNVPGRFKHQKSFETRKDEAYLIRTKYPNKIPIIVERYTKEQNLPLIDRSKFLVLQDVTVSQLSTLLRDRMRVGPTQAFYLLIGERTMPGMSRSLGEVYKEHRDEDGFLYVTYASQETFGCCCCTIEEEQENNILEQNRQQQPAKTTTLAENTTCDVTGAAICCCRGRGTREN